MVPPLLLMVPFLFIAGVVFAYFVVLPAGDRLPAQLQRRPVQRSRCGRATTTASSSPRCSRSGSSSRSRSAILAVTRLGIVTPEQLAQQPPLRDAGDRGRRRCAARRRPGDDADRDGAAGHPLRSEYLARPRLRQAGERDACRSPRPRSARRALADSGERRMLFDMRGRRKRVVQVVYALLAAADGAAASSARWSARSASATPSARGGSAHRATRDIYDEQVERLEQQAAARTPMTRRRWSR